VQRSWEPAEANVHREPDPVKGRPRGPTTRRTLERIGGRLPPTDDFTAQPRHYTPEGKSNPAAQNRPLTGGVVANPPREESELKPLTKDEIRPLLPGANFTFVDASSETDELSGATEPPKEVWRPLWFIVLVAILGLEFLMATTRGHRKEGEESAAPDS